MSSQSKFKKLTDIDPKYLPPKQLDHNGNEIPWSDDPNTITYLMRHAENAKQREKMLNLRPSVEKRSYEGWRNTKSNRGRKANDVEN
jgi:hypothetical protein